MSFDPIPNLYSPNISPWRYLASNPALIPSYLQQTNYSSDSVAMAFVDNHWDTIGKFTTLYDDFNKSSYKARYPDLSSYYGNATITSYAKHYVIHGYGEGRIYNPLSNPPIIAPYYGANGCFDYYEAGMIVGYTKLWGLCGIL